MNTATPHFLFFAGSQDLYGDECLRVVAQHTATIVDGLNASGRLPYPVVLKPTLLDATRIRDAFAAANADPQCAGIITWMHTFSPAKMWIAGLQLLRKPLLHLHTQFNRDIPFDSIDMDFMNTNQSAHGDREFAHLLTRMGIARETVVGHWQDPNVHSRIASWMHTAIGIQESRRIRVVRIGDNMRDVAVTEGDKVEAQLKFGWEIDAWNVTDAAEYVKATPADEIDALTNEYFRLYKPLPGQRNPDEFRQHVRVQAAIELGLRRFLTEHNYNAIVTNFQMLAGLQQLPGLAIQRLMADGYGFGAEGDWKTAALVRILKAMTAGMPNAKGTSFMEDYTYHFAPGAEAILQAHMLEVCPSIAAQQPAIRVEFLSMGQREDPARLVFTSKPGPGIACSLVDLGNRFRLIVSEVECLPQNDPMPNLPVASALWRPLPNLATGAEAWLLAGGAHHTAFSYDISSDQMVHWANAMGIECVVIDRNTRIRDFQNQLRWNASAF